MTQRVTPPSKAWHLPCALLGVWATVACGSGDGAPDPSMNGESQTVAEQPDAQGPAARPAGVHRTESGVTFRTEQFTVEPGQERYVCYTQTLEEDMVVDGYSKSAQPFLHHVVFAKTTGTEPEGSSECPDLFRFEWEPIYLAGTGASEIQFPEGVGQVLPAGTRLLSQLHLLNVSAEPVTDAVELHMHPSPNPDPEPIATYALGNFDVSLPPQQASTVESVCTIPETVELVAAFPHMHLLGTSLTFEVGPSEDELEKVFERDPYDFDDQRLDLLDVTLNEGDVTKVTCNYKNDTDETITFGESTTDEMCFLVGFAMGRSETGGCVIGDPGALLDLSQR